MYVMTHLKTKKQNTLMSNTSANACRETNCTCYSFVTTKTPVITHRGFVFNTLNFYHLRLLQEHVTFYEKQLSQSPYFWNRKALSYP